MGPQTGVVLETPDLPGISICKLRLVHAILGVASRLEVLDIVGVEESLALGSARAQRPWAAKQVLRPFDDATAMDLAVLLRRAEGLHEAQPRLKRGETRCLKPFHVCEHTLADGGQSPAERAGLGGSERTNGRFPAFHHHLVSQEGTRRTAHAPSRGACLPMSSFYGRASSTMLNGVSAARRICEKPPSSIRTFRNFCSPACAPSAGPCFASETGTQMSADAP